GAHALGPSHRALEHARLRVGLPGLLPRVPPVLGAHGYPRREALGARARSADQGAGRVLRDQRVLRLAGDQAVQDPRPGPAGTLPRLYALPGVPAGPVAAP